jgi:periplasmic protein TonB
MGSAGIGLVGNQAASGPICDWCVSIGRQESGPRPPQPLAEAQQPPRTVQVMRLDPAMLIHRIEPVYPPWAKQTHREGRVELRAIIATDGSIQSLEAVAGDPLFYSSALQAVQQWRYRATILNGQPVEIDTFITVIYTLQR